MTLELKRYKDDFFDWSTEPYHLGGVKQIGTVVNHPEYIFIEIFDQRIFNPEIFEYIKDAENGTIYVQNGKWVRDMGIVEINPDFGELVAANDGYCPCAIERNEDTRCMCKEFREQTEGECHCGRYEKRCEDG